MDQNNKEDKTQELIAETDLKGRKLGLLIASLPADDEVKSAFLTLAENSSYEELTQLEDALEVLFLSAQSKDLDEQFEKDLKALKSEMDADERKLDEEFLAKLKEIEDKIKG